MHKLPQIYCWRILCRDTAAETMPRKGQAGLTQEEKDERSEGHRPEDRGDAEGVKGQAQGEYFTPQEMSSVWKRLENARGSAPKTIEAAWSDLKQLKPKTAKQELYYAEWERLESVLAEAEEIKAAQEAAEAAAAR